MTVGFIADLHINIYRKKFNFFDYMQQMINYACETFNKHNVETVVICGDLFHAKSVISTEFLIKANELIQQLSENFHIILIPGNHDLVYKQDNSINLQNNYKYNKKIKVFDSYNNFEINNTVFHCLPFYETTELVEKLSEIKINSSKKNILCSHFGVQGFLFNASSYYASTDGEVDQSVLSQFDKIILGHYHGYQNNGKIIYVSSPLQTRYGDEISQHGFGILDSESLEYTFIENPCTPQFMSVILKTKQDLQNILTIENTHLKINIQKQMSNHLLIKLRDTLVNKNKNLEVIFTYNIPTTTSDGISVVEDWQRLITEDADDLIKQYVDKIEMKFDKTDFLNILFKNNYEDTKC